MSTNPSAGVRVLRIWTDYMNKGGKIVPIDKVEFCAVGMAGKASTIAPISQMARTREPTGPDDQAAIMSNLIWNTIKQHYEAFKKGSELPDHGTPLAAWNGITPEQAAVLKLNGFRSIEDLADATDSALSRIQLPGARGLVEQAKLFLASADRSKVAADLAAKDAQIASMVEQQAELKQIILDMQAELAAKPRRGRPQKVETEQEEEAA